MQNETFTKWPAGTLIEDMGKVGIISKVIPVIFISICNDVIPFFVPATLKSISPK